MRIHKASWADEQEALSAIRRTVFIEEQGVPEELEWDGEDAHALHVLVKEGDAPIGCGRMLPDGHIGRMAVLKEWRNRGIGALMLQALVQEAKRRKYREVVLSAQVNAVPFYRAHGFAEEGDEYLEAGIRHQAMKRRLNSGTEP